jgi:hypothetical protein
MGLGLVAIAENAIKSQVFVAVNQFLSRLRGLVVIARSAIRLLGSAVVRELPTRLLGGMEIV